jgi:hypothetical protein
VFPLAAGFAVVGLCLCAVVAAGVWMWRSHQIIESGTPGVVVTVAAMADAVEVDEATRSSSAGQKPIRFWRSTRLTGMC